ncbi:putative phage abortive infection protein [Achromobacter sp. JUb104]|uniref:putative phage abortive infection protein n=1 Tax=Achromobacter sp. JUb104 TaxID=2940590 RepID=UPI002169FCC5|nr:putative phage abortive infection protein [Achromobacter sp. JUb104]MCS3504469.1 hypothetical protein [Achromobacter sp. JUb104]
MKTPRVRRTFRLIALTSLLPISSACIAFWYYRSTFKGKFSTDQADWGAFGDFMGGIVNPVAGLVTIVLLVLTLRSQQDELEEQRRQLAKQAFEQSFFGWTSSYRELISGLQFGSGTELDPRLTGVIALHEILRLGHTPSNEETHSLIKKMQSVDATEQEEIRATHRSSTVAWWERCFASNEPQLGALIRTLYSLLRWVDSHPTVSWAEKWDAVSIIRARLSGPELRVIYFNGFLHDGKKFNAYVQRYALLDNLPLSGHNRVIIAYRLGLHPFEEASFDSDLARSALLESGEVKPIAETSVPT